jgi:hypothetical protein
MAAVGPADAGALRTSKRSSPNSQTSAGHEGVPVGLSSGAFVRGNPHFVAPVKIVKQRTVDPPREDTRFARRASRESDELRGSKPRVALSESGNPGLHCSTPLASQIAARCAEVTFGCWGRRARSDAPYHTSQRINSNGKFTSTGKRPCLSGQVNSE